MRKLLLLALLSLPASPAGAATPADPFGSVMWDYIAERQFPGETIVFDDRVRVLAPANAENQFEVPVTVEAAGIGEVVEIRIIADLNPLPHVLTYHPVDAEPFIGFRIKLEQASVVHAAARTADGVWHVGGAVVEAAGGGCTAPARAHSEAGWMSRLGEARALALREETGAVRLAMKIRHPMDSGLADGVPLFLLRDLSATDDRGTLLARFELLESVAENPALVIRPRLGGAAGTIAVSGRDTEGNLYDFVVPVPSAEGVD